MLALLRGLEETVDFQQETPEVDRRRSMAIPFDDNTSSVEAITVEVSARARIPVKDRVCWGPLQTRKDTRQILKPLYSCPFGIQAPKLETRIQLNFQFATITEEKPDQANIYHRDLWKW